MTETHTEGPAALHWHVGWNMPGYLPEMEPYTCWTIEDARGLMIDELGFHADNQETWVDEHDCDDIPCPTYGDSCPWMMAQDIRALVDDIVSYGDDYARLGAWNGYAGNLVYWITICTEVCDD